MNMQTKVLDELFRHAGWLKLHPVHNPDFGNTGAVFFQRGFDTILSAKYWFYTEYATVSFFAKGKPLGGRGDDVRFQYDDMAHKVALMLDIITAAAKEHP